MIVGGVGEQTEGPRSGTGRSGVHHYHPLSQRDPEVSAVSTESFVQIGRSLLSDPDLPNRSAADIGYRSRCLHCNECVGTIESPQGIHCTRFSL